MAVGHLAEIVFNRLLTKAVDTALEKLYEMWRRRKAARGEPSPDDAPQQDSSPASAASDDENASMSGVDKEDTSRDVVGSSSG
ncbi:hypothetical protein NW767_009861 [Fusarium falciforme]|nr:hypothetical protein NW767_009861 [Fusarium falciforme]